MSTSVVEQLVLDFITITKYSSDPLDTANELLNEIKLHGGIFLHAKNKPIEPYQCKPAKDIIRIHAEWEIESYHPANSATRYKAFHRASNQTIYFTTDEEVMKWIYSNMNENGYYPIRDICIEWNTSDTPTFEVFALEFIKQSMNTEYLYQAGHIEDKEY